MWVNKPTYIQVKTWLDTVVRPLWINADIQIPEDDVVKAVIGLHYLPNYEQLLRYRPDWKDDLNSNDLSRLSDIITELENLRHAHEMIELDVTLCQP